MYLRRCTNLTRTIFNLHAGICTTNFGCINNFLWIDDFCIYAGKNNWQVFSPHYETFMDEDPLTNQVAENIHEQPQLIIQ